jgi:hypothetical protein
MSGRLLAIRLARGWNVRHLLVAVSAVIAERVLEEVEADDETSELATRHGSPLAGTAFRWARPGRRR